MSLDVAAHAGTARSAVPAPRTGAVLQVYLNQQADGIFIKLSAVLVVP